MERSNEKVHALAAKAVGAWTRGLTQLEKIEGKVRELSDIPAGSLQTYDDLLQKLRGHTVAAKAALTAFEKNKTKALLEKEELTSLPFDVADVKAFQKQAVEVLKDIRTYFPKPAPKAAPKAGSGKRKGRKAESTKSGAPEEESDPPRRRLKKSAA